MQSQSPSQHQHTFIHIIYTQLIQTTRSECIVLLHGPFCNPFIRQFGPTEGALFFMLHCFPKIKSDLKGLQKSFCSPGNQSNSIFTVFAPFDLINKPSQTPLATWNNDLVRLCSLMDPNKTKGAQVLMYLLFIVGDLLCNVKMQSVIIAVTVNCTRVSNQTDGGS